MLTIYKDNLEAVVPSGSFKRMFEPYGWTTKKEGVVKGSKKPSKGPVDVNPSKEASTSPKPNTKDVLSSMTDQELRQYASLLGVKTKGLKTREELLKAIAQKEV